MVSIKQVETFLWVARLGSFAAAAERVCSTPSAVSLRMHELEGTLGVQLFDRTRRSVQLTAKGRELVHLAEELVQVAWRIESSIGDSRAMMELMRIGVGDLIAITWLGDLVSAIRDAYPQVTLDLEIGLTRDLVEKLQNREVDLVLAPDLSDAEFRLLSLGSVEFKWMASPQLGLPDMLLTPKKLEGWPIIALSQQSYHYKRVNNWFKGGNAYCGRAIVCNTIGTLSDLVKRGVGVGLMPASYIGKELRNDSLRIFECDPHLPAVEFFAMYPGDGCSPVVERVAELAAKVSGFRPPS